MDQDLMIFTSQSYGGLILWNFWTRLVNADVRLTPMRGAWVNTRPCWPALHRPCLPRGRCTRRAFFENWPTGLSAGRQGRCSVAGYGYEVNKTSVSETIRKSYERCRSPKRRLHQGNTNTAVSVPLPKFCTKLLPTQNFTEIGQSAAESRPKNDFKTADVRRLELKTVPIWSSGYHRVPNVLLYRLPNFIKVGRLFVEIWRFNDLKCSSGHRPS